MKEKILKTKPGMPLLVLFILLYLAAFGSIILGGILLDARNSIGGLFLAIGIVWILIGFIPFFGFKIIKPQEALVLTLFGKYTGTIKEPGFYFVNPFSSAINPAYKTRLGQSGDVKDEGVIVPNNFVNKKVSLKVMTLNNNKQKINDALGNPIEIGIAVMCKVLLEIIK